MKVQVLFIFFVKKHRLQAEMQRSDHIAKSRISQHWFIYFYFWWELVWRVSLNFPRAVQFGFKSQNQRQKSRKFIWVHSDLEVASLFQTQQIPEPITIIIILTLYIYLAPSLCFSFSPNTLLCFILGTSSIPSRKTKRWCLSVNNA